MKLLHKLLLKVFFLLITLVTRPTSEEQSFSSLMKSAYRASQADAGKILLEAEEKTLNLNQKIERATLELKDQAERRYKELHRESQNDIQEIKRNAAESIERIEQTIEEQADKLRASVKESEAHLKVKASQEILDLLDEADEKILEQRRISRREHFAKQIGSDESLNLSTEWKSKTAQQISSTISMLKNIVLDAEDDETSQEFAEQFSSYQQWFDTSLSMTQSRYEKKYAEIIKRKERLEDLADMQKQADALLNAYQTEKNIDDEEYKKLRLLTLYDLNSAYHIHNKKLSNDDIKEIVSRIITTPQESLKALLTTPEEQSNLVTLAVAEEHKKANELLTAENEFLKKRIEEKKRSFLESEIRTNKLTEQLHECRETLSMTATKLASSQKEIIDLTSTIEELKRKETELGHKTLEIEALKAEIAEHKDTIETLNQEVSQHKEKIVSLEKQQLEQASEQQKLRQEVEKRRTQKRELKKVVEQERKERISSELSYKKTQLENEHCQSRIALLNEQIEIEKKEQERLFKKVKQKEEAMLSLEKQVQELKDLEPKLAASQEQLEWYQNQQEQAQTYQEEQHKIHQNLSQQLSKQEATMNTQQKELQSMQEQLSKLINDKKSTETLLENERAKHQTEKITVEKISQEKQIEAKEKIEYLEAKINRIEAEKKGLEESFSQTASTLATNQKIQEAKVQEALVNQELAQQQKELIEAQMHEKEGALKGLEQQVASTTEEIAYLAEDLVKGKETLSLEKKNLEQDAQKATSQFKQLEEQAKEIRHGIAKELEDVQRVTQQSLEQIQQGKIDLQINEQRTQEEFMEQEKRLTSEKESIEAMLTHVQ